MIFVALRSDVLLQARNGFYFASAFVVVLLGSLLVAIPPAVRSNEMLWVPAILVVNLQITTFFFVAGLLLLERDEGTLLALAVSPFTAGSYLAMRTITLTILAIAETTVLISIAFDAQPSWLLTLLGATTLGVIYTSLGAAIVARYDSMNSLLLPASLFASLLLLPLLPHFHFAPRAVFLAHPLEPSLSLLRMAYGSGTTTDLMFGVFGSLLWSVTTFRLGCRSIDRLMRGSGAVAAR
jgi:fluoroquinolone transport system permease protein